MTDELDLFLELETADYEIHDYVLLENTEGQHNKVYILVHYSKRKGPGTGSHFLVRFWGRHGRYLSNMETPFEEHDFTKIIGEKTGKGYVQVEEADLNLSRYHEYAREIVQYLKIESRK